MAVTRRKSLAVLATAIAVLSVGDMIAPAVASALPSGKDPLRQAIAGLPDDSATGAQVRVGGTKGPHRVVTSGVADLRTKTSVKGDERFRAGSITKSFTASVVLQLVHEKKLRLDGTVQHYLPGLLPASYDKVTVAELLNFTSGLPSADDYGDLRKDRYKTYGHWQLSKSHFNKPMLFKPGTEQHYANIDYNVLALLIEKVTGRSYEQEVRDRVIKPLGLKDTYSPGNGTEIRGRHTKGYQAVKDPRTGRTHLVDVTDWNMSYTWASGDLISTTADLERFMTALFKGRVVPQTELKLMFTVPKVKMHEDGRTDTTNAKDAYYSSGLTRVQIGKNTYVWGKTGGTMGYLSAFGATRDLSRTAVYSVNATDAKSQTPPAILRKITMAAFTE
ncbi:serine hydrolase domain-containing protein [Streptomyces orinoci]|uniref:Serine hydrolase domain-containing protein n=1 Tax=Streptomyces orinoci TaxID=67339 RepID=A0ABV3JTG4_STRON|nr:serine hydrolase domain-containing protein [Streptomyces orinoci]